MAISGPLKWHGGKAYLKTDIINLMPPHTHYVEPFAGGLSVLLAKDPDGVSEVVNDINHELTNFWRVLQDPVAFILFQRYVEAVPFSEREWKDSNQRPLPNRIDVDHAVAFFICCRQSLAGRMKGFTGITKTRTRRRMNNEVSAWLTTVEGLPAVHERLKRVLILDAQDALEVIRKHDTPGTLFYLDPPYLHSTRATTEDYAHEMTREEHARLLMLLADIKGKFLLSGYRSDLYDDAAVRWGWHRHDFDMANNAAGGDEKRRMTECVWCNF